MEARTLADSSPENIHDKIRAKLQQVLSGMNEYICKNAVTVKSDKSVRLQSIKNIAKAIYDYYGKGELLLNDFEINLSDFLTEFEKNKVPGVSNVTLLPELKVDYKSPALPASLHAYHDILCLIESEIKKMPSLLLGRSQLRNKLIAALANSEELAHQLCTNVYIVVFSTDLKVVELFRKPADFANYLYEALTSPSIYHAGPSSVTFKGSNKSYNILFCASKKEAEDTIRSEGYANPGCFGLEFSFHLNKTDGSKEEYIPSLESVHKMNAWQNGIQITSQNEYALKMVDGEFVIKKDESLNLKKQ